MTEKISARAGGDRRANEKEEISGKLLPLLKSKRLRRKRLPEASANSLCTTVGFAAGVLSCPALVRPSGHSMPQVVRLGEFSTTGDAYDAVVRSQQAGAVA